jgi:recombination protein RecR
VEFLPEPISNLREELRKLPGIGPRSAERLALFLAQSDSHLVARLTASILAARQRIQTCQVCGGLTESQPCALCSDARRDPSVICVVEHPTDILALEKSAVFRGKYHVLGGRLSPVQGIGPEDLRLAELEKRLDIEPVKEIILALGSDVEGDATSLYLSRRWAGRSLVVSRLAHGLPVGSGLDFADELTLGRAIEGRRPL